MIATWDRLFRLMRLQDGLVLEALRVRAAGDLVGFRLPKVFRARYSLSSSVCKFMLHLTDQGRRRRDLSVQDAYSSVGHDRGRTS